MEQEMEAPLAGLVVEINIKVGDEVSEDDEALILETMKMKTPILIPCDGIVKELIVRSALTEIAARQKFQVRTRAN